MKCPNCGAEIGPNNKFCSACGSQISYSMRREQEQLNKAGCPKCGSSNVKFNREKQGEYRGKNSNRVLYKTVGFCQDCGYTWFPSQSGRSSGSSSNNNLVLWILGWIFFFPAPVMVLIWRKKNTWDIKVKIAVTVAFWIFVLILGSWSNKSEGSSKDNSTTKEEETADNADSEQTDDKVKADDIASEPSTSEETSEITGYEAIDKCYEELMADNTATDWYDFSKQIRELADKYGLYQDSKNTGLGVRYAKIASTREESKVISNDDLDKGTYYIRIVADFSKGSPDIQLVDNTKTDETPTSTEEAASEAGISFEPMEGYTAIESLFLMIDKDVPYEKALKLIKASGLEYYTNSQNEGTYSVVASEYPIEYDDIAKVFLKFDHDMAEFTYNDGLGIEGVEYLSDAMIFNKASEKFAYDNGDYSNEDEMYYSEELIQNNFGHYMSGGERTYYSTKVEVLESIR